VNNGLAFYATWVTIATMLNFAIALTYDSGGKINFYKYKNIFINLFSSILVSIETSSLVAIIIVAVVSSIKYTNF
jgi:hypothetical protein